MTKCGNGNKFKMAAAAILNSVYRSFRIFARNLARKLILWFCVRIDYNIEQK